MDDDGEDDPDEIDDSRLPLTIHHEPTIRAIIGLVRRKLHFMEPKELHAEVSPFFPP